MAAQLGRYKIFLTAAALVLERVSLHGWRLLSWILFCAGLALLNIPSNFHSYGPEIFFLIWIIGVIYFIRQDALHFTWPRRAQVLRRLEEESGLSHRPLTLLADAPATSQGQGLWRHYHEKLLTVLKHIRPAAPRAMMAQADPFALRILTLLFFGFSVIWAGPLWPERLRSAIMPFSIPSAETAAAAPRVQLWIIPPDYTGASEITLTNSEDKIINVPAGSTVKASVQTWFIRPALWLGEQNFVFTDSLNGQYTLETKLPQSTDQQDITLSVKQWIIPLESWALKIMPDTPPVITLKNEPTALPAGSIRFAFEVLDDYGAKTLTMHMALDRDVGAAPVLGDEITETRSITTPPQKTFLVSPVYDLTSHPWAGLPVSFTFTAADDLKQEVKTPAIQFILPERIFKNPAAQTLISIRKGLLWAPEDGYQDAAKTLEALLENPSTLRDDPIVFLAVRVAASRLTWTMPSKQTGAELSSLLWEAALRVEGDDLSAAAQRLRMAQQALEEALADGKLTPEESEILSQNLREALVEYLSKLQEQLAHDRAQGKSSLPGLQALALRVDPEALGDFLEQFQQAIKDGDMKAAQEMLAQLQRLTDMLNPSLTRDLPQDMQMMSEGINELQELIDKQQALLEQTEQQLDALRAFEAIPRGFGQPLNPDIGLLKDWGIDDLPPAPGKREKQASRKTFIDAKGHSAEQEGLRFILGQLMLDADRALGKIPEKMGLAEQDMRQSSSAFQENKTENSPPHQKSAIKNLKEMQEELSQQLSQRIQQMTGMALNGGQMQLDPLGRPYPNGQGQTGLPGEKVQIPDAAQKTQAHEILKLLRERAGQSDRPEQELKYFRRLLKRF